MIERCGCDGGTVRRGCRSKRDWCAAAADTRDAFCSTHAAAVALLGGDRDVDSRRRPTTDRAAWRRPLCVSLADDGPEKPEKILWGEVFFVIVVLFGVANHTERPLRRLSRISRKGKLNDNCTNEQDLKLYNTDCSPNLWRVAYPGGLKESWSIGGGSKYDNVEKESFRVIFFKKMIAFRLV